MLTPVGVRPERREKLLIFRKRCHFLLEVESGGKGEGIHQGSTARYGQCFEQTSYGVFKLETVTDKDIFQPAVCSGLSPNSISNAVHCLKSLYSEVVPKRICRGRGRMLIAFVSCVGQAQSQEIE